MTCPAASASGSERPLRTAATSALVVPRSIPTARRRWCGWGLCPGSAICSKAMINQCLDIRRAAIGAPALIVEALFQLADLVRELVEKLHATHQALGLFAARSIIPTNGKTFVELILSHFQTPLELRNARQVCAVVQVFQLFAQLHLLQQEIRILHRHFQRQLRAAQCQQIAGTLRRTLKRTVSLVETGGLLEGQALITL